MTKKAASYPFPLVRDILKTIGKVKQIYCNANYPRDPVHMTIPDSLLESEHAIQIVYSQSTMTAHDSNPSKGVDWGTVVLRRTIDRKTGVVMSEDYTAALTEEDVNRQFEGHLPKEVLTVFFYWDSYRPQVLLNNAFLQSDVPQRCWTRACPRVVLLHVSNGLEIACPWLLVLHWSYELLLRIL